MRIEGPLELAIKADHHAVGLDGLVPDVWWIASDDDQHPLLTARNWRSTNRGQGSVPANVQTFELNEDHPFRFHKGDTVELINHGVFTDANGPFGEIHVDGRRQGHRSSSSSMTGKPGLKPPFQI